MDDALALAGALFLWRKIGAYNKMYSKKLFCKGNFEL